MKKIKNVNGYAIYQAGARDVKKYGFEDGGFYVYFASDVRDFGLTNSTPEFEGCGSLEEAEANCTGNFARAKEIVEERTTAASMEEILEVEAMLDAGIDPDDIDEDDGAHLYVDSLTDEAIRAADQEYCDWEVEYEAGRIIECLTGGKSGPLIIVNVQNNNGIIGCVHAPVVINNSSERTLSEQENRLLNIFGELDVMERAKLLVYADELKACVLKKYRACCEITFAEMKVTGLPITHTERS